MGIFTIKYNKTTSPTAVHLIYFLKKYNLFVDNSKMSSNEDIRYNADNVKSLNDVLQYKLIKFDYLNIIKFISDLCLQILIMKKNNYGVLFIRLSDITVINSNHYLFNPKEEYIHRLNGDDIDIKRPADVQIPSDEVETKSFLSPEIIAFQNIVSREPTKVNYVAVYFSLALLILYVFDLNIEDDMKKIYNTNIYFFLKRCLNKNPSERVCLFV